MTTTPIRDAITGDPVNVERHHRHVLVGYNGGNEMWLTPAGALQLAHVLMAAAHAVIDANALSPEGTRCEVSE
jgi:hypothetical protein